MTLIPTSYLECRRPPPKRLNGCSVAQTRISLRGNVHELSTKSMRLNPTRWTDKETIGVNLKDNGARKTYSCEWRTT